MKSIVLVCVVVVLAALGGATTASMLDPFNGPGYGLGVGEATLVNEGGSYVIPDGSQVNLTCVCCSKIEIRCQPNYWDVQDVAFALGAARLRIFGAPPREIEPYEPLNVSGTLSTLPDGSRMLSNVSVSAYLDDSGAIIYHGLFRDTLSSPWPNVTELLPPDCVSSQSLQSGFVRACDDSPPGDGGDGSDSAAAPIFCPDVPTMESVYDPNNAVFIEADCMNISSVDSVGETFTIVDSADDSILCYWSQSDSLDPSDIINTLTGNIQADSTGTNFWVEIDYGPNWLQGDTVGAVMAIQDAPTIPYAWVSLPVEGPSLQTINGVVVSANNADFGGTCYVQCPKGSPYWGGIRVVTSSGQIPRGEVVDIVGQTGVGSGGEVQINANVSGGSIAEDSAGFIPEPQPLFMETKALGGQAMNHYDSGISSPDSSGVGPDNKGMLVKIAGTVTAIEPTDFYVDDGYALKDASGDVGVRVSWAWSLGAKTALTAPPIGSVVEVKGISSCDSTAAGYIRVVRPREQDDIMILAQNANYPSVTITTPPDGTLHVDSTAGPVLLAGTAAAGFGVTNVTVKVDSATLSSVNYSALSSVNWTCTWSPTAGTHLMWVGATDSAGHEVAIEESVTVSYVTPIYVSDSGGGSPFNGSSWQHPFQTVNAAMSADSSGGDIWVAQGKYEENATVALETGVGLYGGPRRAAKQRASNGTGATTQPPLTVLIMARTPLYGREASPGAQSMGLRSRRQ